MSAIGIMTDTANLLGAYYLAAAFINGLAAWRAWATRRRASAAVWVLAAGAFAAAAAGSFRGHPPGLPEWFKSAVDAVAGPVTLSLASLAFLAMLYAGRSWLVRPQMAMVGFDLALAALGCSLTDPEFAAVVLKPDNVAIVAMIFLLGFFLWLGTAQAVENDRRLARGLSPREKEFSETTLVWPDLVYIELIAMVVGTAVLVAWALVLPAPLEQPANPVITPNPAKAPWYFLGLQELLVYFDPWLAGVVVPTLIIFGLAVIPYLDPNPKGSGYYTIAERKFAWAVFLFGFVQLWILWIVIGTFFRGPNWSFFGPYEPRDPHRVAAAQNIRLCEYFWVFLLGREVPLVEPGDGSFRRTATLLLREWVGIAGLGVYFVGLPALLGRTLLRDFRRRMGRWRYYVMVLLLLMMLALPLKMFLRWSADVSYIASFPEWQLSF